MISSTSSKRLMVGSTSTLPEAIEYIMIKEFDGWRVLVPPFASDQALLDVEDDVTRPIITEFTFVLHRF